MKLGGVLGRRFRWRSDRGGMLYVIRLFSLFFFVLNVCLLLFFSRLFFVSIFSFQILFSFSGREIFMLHACVLDGAYLPAFFRPS